MSVAPLLNGTFRTRDPLEIVRLLIGVAAQRIHEKSQLCGGLSADVVLKRGYACDRERSAM